MVTTRAMAKAKHDQSSVVEKKDRFRNLQESIETKMIETGEMERLKEILRKRLQESGWIDEMKNRCRLEFAKEEMMDNFTLSDLVDMITPIGKASVPVPVKAELLQQIETSLANF